MEDDGCLEADATGAAGDETGLLGWGRELFAPDGERLVLHLAQQSEPNVRVS